jgi:hypothetical protein
LSQVCCHSDRKLSNTPPWGKDLITLPSCFLSQVGVYVA